jgi:predicted DNA-binding transcriptional regulator YafY
MFYQRCLEIERRLDEVLRLIRNGGFSTPMIAQRLSVSIPTVSRDVTALRERGHDIRSVRKNDAWEYVVIDAFPTASRRRAYAEARP